MNADQIDAILKRRCRIYRGIYACDELPILSIDERPAVLIVNTDPRNKIGTHWLGIYLGLHSNEYFDSFGRAPTGLFEKYVSKHDMKWTFNRRQLQSIISKFCGHYCIMYAICRGRGHDLDTMLKLFSNDTGLNDFLVHKFVCQML
jgi:hypothetical protein